MCSRVSHRGDTIPCRLRSKSARAALSRPQRICGTCAATRATARGRPGRHIGPRASTRRSTRGSHGAQRYGPRDAVERARLRRAHGQRRTGRRSLPDVPRRGRRHRLAPALVHLPGIVRVDARDVPDQACGGRASAATRGAALCCLGLLPVVQVALYRCGEAAARDRAVDRVRARRRDERGAHYKHRNTLICARLEPESLDFEPTSESARWR